ncbi:MAG: BrnA antitoxin family protein [Macromonas sp.]
MSDAFFNSADEYVGDQLVRRGRPKASQTKQALTVRYDTDVIKAFRATGKGWQTRMNAALKDWLKTHSPA